MMKPILFASALGLTLTGVVACTDDKSQGNRGANGSSPDESADAGEQGDPSDGSAPTIPVALDITGKLGGATFKAVDGFFTRYTDGVGIYLTAYPKACAKVQSHKAPAGGKHVEIYDLADTAPGTYMSPRTSGVVVKSSCTPGMEVDESELAYFEQATKSKVTFVASATDKLEGSVDITFPDGSRVTGTFSVSECEDTPGDGAICE